MLNDKLINPEENNKRLRLKSAKLLAALLLLFCVVAFVLSTLYYRQYPGLGYVKAFSEAAMVGALADWFAVEALFRHPLGASIPHTAIIPASKKRIAQSMAEFITTHFLTTSTILEKVRHFDLAGRIVRYLSTDAGQVVIGRYALAGLGQVLGAVNHEQVAQFVRAGLAARLREVDLSDLASSGLSLMMRDNAHHVLLNYAIDQVDDLLSHDDARDAIRARAVQKLRMLKYLGLDGLASDKLSDEIVSGVAEYIHEVRNDARHPLRQGFDQLVLDWSARLKQDPVLKVKGGRMRDAILANKDVEHYFEGLWRDLSAWIAADLKQGDSEIRLRVMSILKQLALHLDQDTELKATINHELERWVPVLIERYRDSVGAFISSRIIAWDDDFMVDQLELSVGRDLQFIRINGTVVGGLVGLLIYLVSMALTGR